MPKKEILNLRPTKLEDFFGQNDIINQLKVFLFSAKKRKSSLDHLLFYGPPGLGKTTLANVIANELESKIISVSAPSIESIGEMVEIVSQISEGNILFIDEIHRLEPEIEEILYSVLEDSTINISYKNEDRTKILSLNLPHFTIIGATTNASKLSTPLRDRFGIVFKFSYYSNYELSQIIQNNAKKLSLNIGKESALEIARRSRKTPRVSNNILKRLLDYKIYNNLNNITQKDISNFFDFIDINESGLTKLDFEIISIFYNKFSNTGVSMDIIAQYLNENPNDIIQINEPYLVNLGLIERTKTGRKLTESGKNLYKKYLEKHKPQF